MRRVTVMLQATAVLAAVSTSAQSIGSDAPMDLAGILARVGERVEAYYQRAQSIVCVESVQMQTMDNSLMPDPHTRRLVYELRVSWDKTSDGDEPTEANVLRTLKTINGKPPKDGQEPGCLDPKPVSLDPLSFLLPQHQREYKFTYQGIGKVGNGRTGVMIDYAPAGKPPPEIVWHDSCVSINLPQQTRGRAQNRRDRVRPIRHSRARRANAQGRSANHDARSRGLDDSLSHSDVHRSERDSAAARID